MHLPWIQKLKINIKPFLNDLMMNEWRGSLKVLCQLPTPGQDGVRPAKSKQISFKILGNLLSSIFTV